jgi:hypothetical protein
MAVVVSELTLERELRRTNAAFLLVYLYRPFPGVTLADRQMVCTIGLASLEGCSVAFVPNR